MIVVRETEFAMKSTWIGLVGLAVLASTGACGRTEDTISETSGTLRRARSCGELDAMLKADALVKMNKQIDSMIQSFSSGGYGYAVSKGTALGAPERASGSSTPGGSADQAGTYSQTNTQVKGVDEADFVKNDGKYIYLLHGSSFRIVNAYPVEDFKEASNLTIDGEPTEMFVTEGKVVIYSVVDGKGIYKAAGVSPRASYYDYGYATSRGGVVSAGSSVEPTPPQVDNSVGTKCINCTPEATYAPLLKVTVLTIANGTQATVARELYFEGSYLSSRRVGSNVRTIITGGGHGPVLKMYPDFSGVTTNGTSTFYPQTADDWKRAFEILRIQNTYAINSSTYADWVPYQFERSGEKVTASTVACTDHYLPGTASTDFGRTEVMSIDLNANTTAPKSAAIFASTDTVYENGNSLYLAAHGWNDPGPLTAASMSGASGGSSGSSGSGTITVTPAEPPKSGGGTDPAPKNIGLLYEPVAPLSTITLNKTYLHKFDFSNDLTQPLYVATGSVPGSVANQFYLDERNGTLRVATTEQRETLVNGTYYNLENVNHLYTLQVKGGSLVTVGDAGDLAKGETIHSVRYVGTRGYVVTYRQIDPLFVFDLSDPTRPTKLAELKIPGFSEYMEPLDDGHLLTIGKEAEGNHVTGLALQIFDVSQGTAPQLVHKYVFSADVYGQSEAEYNHKAFTYYPEKQLLSFPYYAYDQRNEYGMKSTAELFSIDIANGIKKIGAVDHSDLFGKNYYGYCGGSFSPYVRRSVFMDNVLYSVSYAGVKANDASTLTSLGTLVLPEPTYSGGPYGVPTCVAPNGGGGL